MSSETFKNNQQIMSIPDFIYTHPFEDAIERLIMCRIWMSGSIDCMGVRYLSLDALAKFCCCSPSEVYDTIAQMTEDGHIGVRCPSQAPDWLPDVAGQIGFILKPEWQIGECDGL
jgi:AraC-like DNA-binding protein